MRRGGLVAMALVITVAACGDDGGGLSKDAYITEADEACARFSDAVGTPLGQIFEGGEIIGMDVAPTAFPDFDRAVRTLLDERQALEPPDGDGDTIADVNTIERRTFEQLLADAKAAIDAGDPEALGAAFDLADAGFQEIDPVQQDYGFLWCGARKQTGEPAFEVVPQRGTVGTAITVRSLTPCAPAPEGGTGRQAKVSLWSTSTRLGTRGGRILAEIAAPTGDDGTWSVAMTVPAAGAGEHTIAARCDALHPDCPTGCPYAEDLIDRPFVVVPS